MSTKSPRRSANRDERPSPPQLTVTELGAVEHEKERLSIELHDGVGQHLTGIAFLAKALANRLSAGGAAETAEAEQIVHLTNEAIANIRALARGLRPVGLEDNALAVALAQLARDATRVYGVECLYTADEPVTIASAFVSHHLYRIAQEGVHNAVKHGTPGRITVDLAAGHQGMIVLTVVNQGILDGLRSEAQRDSPGIGIAAMRYRAALIGAKLTLETIHEEAVKLRVTIDGQAAQTLQHEGEHE